jgi:hypothetical protein
VRSALDDALSRVSDIRVLRWTSSSPSYRRAVLPPLLLVGAVKRASQEQPPAGAHSASRRCRVHSQPRPRTSNIRRPLVAPRPRPARLDAQQGHPTCSGGSCSRRPDPRPERSRPCSLPLPPPQAGEDINHGERIAHPRHARESSTAAATTVPAPTLTRIRDPPGPDYESSEAVRGRWCLRGRTKELEPP